MHNTKPAYQLNWGLTIFWRERSIPTKLGLQRSRRVRRPTEFESSSITLPRWEASQFFVSTQPSVAPSALIRSIKGRLQYVVRRQTHRAFRRNYCVRSIGSATRSVVEGYVAEQLGHHRMADPHLESRLSRFQKCFAHVDLRKPSFSSHGEYWYKPPPGHRQRPAMDGSSANASLNNSARSSSARRPNTNIDCRGWQFCRTTSI